MTARAVISGGGAPREAGRVCDVMKILAADESQVRRLVKDGELESFRIGKRGVRIYLDTVADYQARRNNPAKPVDRTQKARTERKAATSAALRSAMAELRAEGVIP